jgi:hypothetical protein
MKNINLYISYKGVHTLINDAVADDNNAKPISKLFDNICLPRLESKLTEDFDSTLSNLFEISETTDVQYHIGFFYNSLKGETFTKFFNLCPKGTRVFFVKTDEKNHNIGFKDFLNMMIKINRGDIFNIKFQEGTYTDYHIKVMQEESSTTVDDLADDFGASDWEPFKNNKLQVRKFIKL